MEKAKPVAFDIDFKENNSTPSKQSKIIERLSKKQDSDEKMQSPTDKQLKAEKVRQENLEKKTRVL